MNAVRNAARLANFRIGAWACVAALLAGCTWAENLSLNAQAAAQPSDGRILLGATQRITVAQREVQNYTCGNLALFCTSWGTMFNCYCQ